ncbi:MAG: hypothetical protein LBN36_07080 [Clostridiales Family XIII bacterium]|jgi:hypothetical protein|nr:hypothetical protein [Clostridiales Family XIII bacterium]
MDFDELLELLEIDSPKDLSFFEQFAELAECESEIPLSAIELLFAETDQDGFAELTEAYFEDTLKSVPDDQTEFYTLFMSIGKALHGLASAADTLRNRQDFAEEFFRFRNWYVLESEVVCTSEENGTETVFPVMQALALARAEILTGEELRYDFSDALDYNLDGYIMPLGGFSAEAPDSDLDEEADDVDFDTYLNEAFAAADAANAAAADEDPDDEY